MRKGNQNGCQIFIHIYSTPEAHEQREGEK